MRLYLSSFRIGNHPQEFVRLVGSNKKVAIIMNARDDRNTLERTEKLKEEVADLTKLGFSCEELDLRDYFGKRAELTELLSTFGALWVRGGNTFILKRAFEESGFDEIIKKMLMEDSIVYAGYSAGVVILAPSMHGLEIVDDPNIVPEGYKKEFDWTSLGLIPYAVAVHYKSPHPESLLVDTEVEYYKTHNIPYKILRDGEVILIEEKEEKYLQ